MKRFFNLVTVVSLVVLPAAQANAADDHRTEFSQLYVALRAAMRSHDPASVKAMLAPGFASYDANGHKETAADMLAKIVKLPDDPKRKANTEVQSVELVGNKALVVQHYTMSTEKPGPDGVPYRIQVSAVSDDVWIRVSGAWLLLKTTTREATMVKDDTVAVPET